MYPKPTSIYHITHLANLASILENGGLLCVSEIKENGKGYTNIAHNNIQDRRSNFQVPLPPKGNLHDYVPFYFAPRSPMLYTIDRGNVEGYREGQAPVIYLVSDVQTIIEKNIPHMFTDGHAIVAYSQFYNEEKDLVHVDWNVMNSRYWNDTDEFPDRKRKRQAEFLIHKFVPFDAITGIGVFSLEYKLKVENELEKAGISKAVKQERNWYY
jgi:ssDNA thymidine ADP-ribosyltransferase, DarT